MKDSNQKGKVTLANILAIVGIVLLGVFSYLGELFLSGGEMGYSILYAVAVAIGCTALFILMIKAKGVEKDFKLWRMVEYATLGVYILVAICTYSSMAQYFSINGRKSELKKMAERDIAQVDSLFIKYEKFEVDAVRATRISLEKTVDAPLKKEVDDFMSNRSIRPNLISIHYYCDTIMSYNLLLGKKSNYPRYRESYKKMIEEWKANVSAWSVLSIPFMANDLQTGGESVPVFLNGLSKKGQLPIIGYDGVCYIRVENQYIDLKTPDLKFKKSLEEKADFSFWALLFWALIHLLVLFNYLVAYRSGKTGIGELQRKKKGETLDDGGHTL